MAEENTVKKLFTRVQGKLSFTEQLRFIWWSIRKKYKLIALDDGLKSGLTARQAFDLAQEADESYRHTGGRAKTTRAYKRSLARR